MTNTLRIAAAFIAALLFTSTAEAKHRHRHIVHHRTQQVVSQSCQMNNDGRYVCSGQAVTPQPTATPTQTHLAKFTYSEAEKILPHPSGCPRVAFCACGVSMKLWGKAKHMLARAFFQYPVAKAAPGMVAVRRHHVMLIDHLDANGNAVVYDPNSGGHQTRIHVRSLAGYSIRNPNLQTSRSL